MRVVTPQIAFHQKDGKNDPILGLDMHSTCNVLATAGSDNEVKLWRVGEGEKIIKEGESPFTFLCTVGTHNASVNAVRFSPDGKRLASCSDDNSVKVMECKPGKDWTSVVDEKDLVQTQLRAHAQDVSDLDWSRNSRNLLTGSVDGKVLVWNADNRSVYPGHSFDDHGHFVQGVAWDPYGHYFCTESADRSVKLYKACPIKALKKGKRKRATTTVGDSAIMDGENKGKQNENKQELHPCEQVVFNFVLHADLTKRTYSVLCPPTSATTINNSSSCTTGEPTKTPEKTELKKKSRSLFLDDSVPTFFRRPAFSPDGLLLVCPTGYSKNADGSKAPTTLVYLRGQFNNPALHLPGASKASVGVRFSPMLLELRDDNTTPWLDVPYRMVFAVATLDAVFIYDTQHVLPIAAAEQLHLSHITDLAWTFDGLGLVVSSNDGYCSVMSMSREEMGNPLPKDKLPMIVKHPSKFTPLLEMTDKVLETTDKELETTDKTDKPVINILTPVRFKPESSAKQIRRITPVSIASPQVESKNKNEKSMQEQSERRIQPVLVTATETESPGGTKRKIIPTLVVSNERPVQADSGDPAACPAPPKKKRATLTLVSPLHPTTSLLEHERKTTV